MDINSEQTGVNKKVVIAAIAGVVVVAAGVVTAIILRNRADTGTGVFPGGNTANANQPAGNEPQANGNGNGNVNGSVRPPLVAVVPPEAIKNPEPESLPPGIERPLTAEEKEERRLDPNSPFWLKTTSPTDGSPPVASLFIPESMQALDLDKDGLSDAEERKIGTDPSKEDTDGDGVSDGLEVLEAHEGFDPKKADSDGDGVPDGEEFLGHDPPAGS